MKTQKVIDSFTPLIKKSIQQYVNDSMNAKIKTALSKDSDDDNEEISIVAAENPTPEKETHESKIVTTIEELEAYAIIKSILRTTVDSERIAYRDTESYFGILLDDNNRKWICRVYLMTSVKYIAIADENKKPVRYDIEGIDDIYKYSKEITDACNRYL